MFIELTELLLCPACRPSGGDAAPSLQGLVARVDRLEGRRVQEGFLGCPNCEARYPIQDGAVRLAVEEPDDGGPGEAGGGPPGASVDPGEAAAAVAALLGLAEGEGGYVLLGPGLASAAAGVATSAPGVEVVVLREPGASGPGRPGAGREAVSALELHDPERWPFRPGRFRGVALLGGSAARVAEAARALVPGGRLVVLSPAPGAVRAVGASGLETLASEARALVAARPS